MVDSCTFCPANGDKSPTQGPSAHWSLLWSTVVLFARQTATKLHLAAQFDKLHADLPDRGLAFKGFIVHFSIIPRRRSPVTWLL
jgi:hypothetical protein